MSDFYNIHQQRAMIIASVVSGTLSLLGSSAVLYMLWKQRKKRMKHVYHRILCAMSILDCMSSLNYIFAFLAVPQGAFLWARGTTLTCAISGFIVELGTAVALYNLGLAVYFFFVICKEKKDRFIARYVEPFIHGVSLLLPLGFAIWAWMDSAFNPLNRMAGMCFIYEYPANCSKTVDVECTRGHNWRLIGLVSGVGTLLPVWVGIITSLVFVWCHVRRQEKKTVRYELSTTTKTSDNTLKQATMYVGAFFITYIACAVNQLYQGDDKTALFTLGFLSKLTFPIQGFFNCLVYMRPRYIAMRTRNKHESSVTLVWAILKGSQTSVLTPRLDLSHKVHSSCYLEDATSSIDLTASEPPSPKEHHQKMLESSLKVDQSWA